MKNLLLVLLFMVPALMFSQGRMLISNKVTWLSQKNGGEWIPEKTEYKTNVWELVDNKFIWRTNNNSYYIVMSQEIINNDEVFYCLGRTGQEATFVIKENVLMIILKYKENYWVSAVFDMNY